MVVVVVVVFMLRSFLVARNMVVVFMLGAFLVAGNMVVVTMMIMVNNCVIASNYMAVRLSMAWNFVMRRDMARGFAMVRSGSGSSDADQGKSNDASERSELHCYAASKKSRVRIRKKGKKLV
ncbi:hypothetical protein F5887DRAFT_999976 [Amanita rubescens]|nr:hypothetical protein F5887DRAFT_999976 [Amanita rubescens]